MSTPQDPARRAKLKRRRTKKLAEWRLKQETKKPAAAKSETAPAAKAKPAAKTARKTA